MFRRFCNLCQVADAKTIHGLKYIVPPILGQTHADIVQHDVQNEMKFEPPEQKKIPIIVCKRKEFNFYSGTTYKKFDPMPIASEGWHHSKSKGDYFTMNPVLQEDDEGDVVEQCTFHDLNLDPRLIENVTKRGIYMPTTIQKRGIPEILDGQNITITAETGCGKTLTFLLPIVNQILRWQSMIRNRPGNSPLALIITPSKELTLQISTEARKLTQGLDIDVKTLLSGRTKKLMRNPSVKNVDILVGTLGVTSKLTTVGIYKLDHVRHTVLDEAHALFDKTFDDKMKHFLRKINFGFKQSTTDLTHSSQLTLASATMPPELPQYLSNSVDVESLINVATRNFHRILVPQKFLRLGLTQKPAMLLKLLKSRAAQKNPTLVFSNTSATSDWISIFLNHMNIKATSLNGQMSDRIRKDKFNSFRKADVNILSTTNSGARGLDTTMVDCIINYDFPMHTADYIHRCGRTGRVGGVANGRVINFISRPLEIDLVQKIERSTRRGHPLPIFNIQLQKEEKIMAQELKNMLESASQST